MKASTVSRRQILAIATAAATAMIPSALSTAYTDDLCGKLLDEELLARELALHARVKTAMRSWRLTKDYTQDEAGKLLGISGSEYAEYEEKAADAGDFLETGEVNNGVPLFVLVRFCEATDTDPATLLFDDSDLQAFRLRQAALAEGLGSLPYRRQKVLRQIAAEKSL